MSEFVGVAKIYALIDNEDRPFYVGCTVQDIQIRLDAHLYEAMKSLSWSNRLKIKKIRSLKFKVGVRILDYMCVAGKTGFHASRKASELEKKWIKRLLSEGYDLCNSTHGARPTKRGEKMRMILSAEQI